MSILTSSRSVGRMISRPLVASQIAYYEARAEEYEASINYRSGVFSGSDADSDALGWLQVVVRTMPLVMSTLELGCGTGIWTRELLRTSRQLHAVDSSPQMLALNRRACGDAATYERANIFEWEPSQRSDRIAAAFLLSHLPDDLLTCFVERVYRWNSDHGELLLIDETVPAENESTSGETIRELANGTRFPIVKIYRNAEQFAEFFKRANYKPKIEILAGRFLALILTKA